MTRPRTFTQIDGMLDERAIYTSEGLAKAIGMGRETLAQARQSGMVKPVELHPRLLYFGSEIVAWLKTLRDQQEKKL